MIFILLFGLLPIDMLNGYLLHRLEVASVISISQMYKIILLGLLFVRVNTAERVIFLFVFLLLLSPTLYQVLKGFNIQLIFIDIIKIFKYLASVLAFFYFRSILINKGYLLKWVYRWILFSFIILVINIFIKLLGIGFPMYSINTFEIGSKGLFYAGNEVSAVLLILSSFLMYWYQYYDNNRLFVIVGLLAILTGLYITSKAAILGTIFTFGYFLVFNSKRKRISIKSFSFLFFFFFILLPSGGYFILDYLKNSNVMVRISYFWDRLDIYTFILSNRNTFLFDFIEIFKEKYNFLEMIIGVGQSTFETLNHNHIIELDFFDIYFAYGLVGIFLFLFYISFIYIKAKLKSLNSNIFIFSYFTKYIAMILIALSFLSGHIFNSGMAAIYIGCVFSLMYYKPHHEDNLI